MRLCRHSMLVVPVLVGCSAQPPVNLAPSLLGTNKATFLQCSGPPQLSETQGDQEQITFLTNRSAGTGLVSPAAAPLLACSGNAVFRNGRLVSVTFGGDQAVCNDVFAPCQGKGGP
jgi:hypothetical protein